MPFFLTLFLLSFSQLCLISASDPLRRCTTLASARTYAKCMPLPTQQASIAWTYNPEDSTLDLAFFGTFLSHSGWVAWGINPVAAQMTGAHALVAFLDPSSASPLLLPFLLNSSVKLQATSMLTSYSFDIHLVSSSVVIHRGASGSTAAGTAVEIHASPELPYNKTIIHHVWNRGLYMQGYSPTIHPTAPTDLASRATFDVVSSVVTARFRAPPSMPRSFHATINSISWGFLLPAGAAAARYLRQYESIGPSWLYAHAALQIIGFLLGIAGFASGLVLGGFSEGVVYELHRRLGVAAACTGSLQSLALLFRPSVTHKFRKYWKSYHHFLGYACVVLGVVNVFQGFGVMGIGGRGVVLGYCLVLSTLLGVCMALEANSWVMLCRRRREEEEGGFKATAALAVSRDSDTVSDA